MAPNKKPVKIASKRSYKISYKIALVFAIIFFAVGLISIISVTSTGIISIIVGLLILFMFK